MPSSSPSSLASSSSSPSQQPEAITATLINLKTQINTLQARYDALLSQLDAHVRDGTFTLNDNALEAHGYRFTHCTRRSYSLPPDHPITAKEKALKAERELAIALGEATEKLTHYWSLKPVKP